jgi:hypothetical protein
VENEGFGNIEGKNGNFPGLKSRVLWWMLYNIRFIVKHVTKLFKIPH